MQSGEYIGRAGHDGPPIKGQGERSEGVSVQRLLLLFLVYRYLRLRFFLQPLPDNLFSLVFRRWLSGLPFLSTSMSSLTAPNRFFLHIALHSFSLSFSSLAPLEHVFFYFLLLIPPYSFSFFPPHTAGQLPPLYSARQPFPFLPP